MSRGASARAANRMRSPPSAARGRPRQRDPRALRRQDWIDAARRMLVARGVERVRVEALARTLRITRGSFYWHFRSRKALLDSLLEDWRVRNTAPFLAAAADERRSGEDKFRAIVDVLARRERVRSGLRRRDPRMGENFGTGRQSRAPRGPPAHRPARRDLPGARLRSAGSRDPRANHLLSPGRLLRAGPQGIRPDPPQARADIHSGTAQVA